MNQFLAPVFSFLALSTALSCVASAAVTCQDIAKAGDKAEVVRKSTILTEANWKSFDVIAQMDRRQCKDSISQELIRVKGELFWRFASDDDGCDGGNSFGSIYSYDLKTVVAHIYDSEVTCSKTWTGLDSAASHVCDMKAQAMAQEKMKEFGLEISDIGSTLEFHEGYLYSYVHVLGTIASKDNREVSVSVATDLTTCNIGEISIEDLVIKSDM